MLDLECPVLRRLADMVRGLATSAFDPNFGLRRLMYLLAWTRIVNRRIRAELTSGGQRVRHKVRINVLLLEAAG